MMIMDESELKKLIEKHETEQVELKPSLSQINEIVESVSAFSNAGGGKILVGVSNSGKILGVDVGKDTIERLTNKIVSNTEPKVYPKISVEGMEGKKVIAVDVKKSEETVLAFGRPFKRVGKSTVRIGREEYEKRVLERKKSYWDSRVCEEAGLEDIDGEKVKWFLRKAKYERKFDVDEDTPVNEALERLELLKNGMLANAAVLLFGKNPQKYFLQAETRCARFKGTEPLEFIDMKVFGGNIFDQRDDAVEFVKEHIKLHAKIVGTEREETWEYPVEAVREGITNAICHRDYEISSKVQIRIFDDRIEVWSPGTLMEGLTVEKLKGKHESVLRNPLLGKCFFLVKFIEQWGTGTNRIIKETVNHGLPEPAFEDTKTSFILTFRKSKLTEEYIERLGLSDRQKKAILHIKEHKKITSGVYADLFGITERMARNDIKALIGKKIIGRKGESDKTAYYVLEEI